jgi:hypothetical protein
MRVLGREAAIEVGLDLHVKMRLDLLAQFGV